MHEWQFSLGMKLTQNCVRKFNMSELWHVDGLETRPYIDSRDQVNADGSIL